MPAAGLVATATFAVVTIVRYRMFLRAVERYGANHDHDKVVEYAAAIRPHPFRR